MSSSETPLGWGSGITNVSVTERRSPFQLHKIVERRDMEGQAVPQDRLPTLEHGPVQVLGHGCLSMRNVGHSNE